MDDKKLILKIEKFHIITALNTFLKKISTIMELNLAKHRERSRDALVQMQL